MKMGVIMKRINVTLFDETYEKLEVRMKNNGEKSIAHSIRELVDLGLKIEAAAEKNNENTGENDFEKLLEMLKRNLNWALETRLLTRHLVENLPGSSKEKQIDILNKYKESANQYIKGFLGETVE